MSWQPDDDADVEDFEENDADGKSDAEELSCPSCGRMIFEDTDRCPYCGDWVMPLAAAARSRGWMWWAALVLAMLVLVAWSLA